MYMKNEFDSFFNNVDFILKEDCLTLPFERGKKEENIVSFKSDNDPTRPAQTDNPPVEGDPDIIAKRNRRLRSRTRNWQLWSQKDKKWVNPNARYTRRRDADEEIKKMNPSD